MTELICIDCLIDNTKPDNILAVTLFNGSAVCALHARDRHEVTMHALGRR